MASITAVVGSPKRADNSMTAGLVKDLFTRLRELVPELKAELICLSERNVDLCKGCLMCQTTGQCQLDDDVVAIRDELRRSDMLVFASPVHISQVSAIYKNFLERMLVGLHTFEFLGKPSLTVITANGSGEQDTKKYLNHMALLFGCIPVGTVVRLDNEEFDQKAYSSVLKNAAAILSGTKSCRPTFRNTLYFMSMKSIIMKNESYFQYEAKVWKERGWEKSSFRKLVSNLPRSHA